MTRPMRGPWTAWAALVAVSVLSPMPVIADAASTPRRIEIAVTADGFEPEGIRVRKGEKVTLVFTRRAKRACAKKVVVQISEKEKVARKLPLNHPVEITVTFPRKGKLRYACAMDMHGGVVLVQ